MRKAKFSLVAAVIFVVITFSQCILAQDDEEVDRSTKAVTWNDQEWASSDQTWYPRGRIVYYSMNTEVCNSWVLVPGTAILPTGLLAVAYCLSLIYLFLGISIVSDIFMSGIEKITSENMKVEIKNEDGMTVSTKNVPVWNATVANLTLMALGSSAPEILLSVIETMGGLGKCPGELGASTIVGSAAFNLLVISAVSIYAVNEANDVDEERDSTVPVGVKKIYDMGVFSITCTSSLFAYIWLFICVKDNLVTPTEAWLTFVFFFILIALSFAADRYKASQNKSDDLVEADGMAYVQYKPMEIYRELIAEKQGKASMEKSEVDKRQKMKEILKEYQNTDNITNVNFDQFKQQIQGDSMLNRIKYRKQVGSMMNGKRPVIGKGEIIRQEHAHADLLDEKVKNEFFGFKCLHYSVSEASGSIQIHVHNKKGMASSVRVCTIDAEAKAGDDYEEVKQTLEFKSGEFVKFISVKIRDDDNWEPDEDFYVQLYNPNTMEEL
jgi:solute carrier family 8 (sodium/calcium exchanger)